MRTDTSSVYGLAVSYIATDRPSEHTKYVLGLVSIAYIEGFETLSLPKPVSDFHHMVSIISIHRNTVRSLR